MQDNRLQRVLMEQGVLEGSQGTLVLIANPPTTLHNNVWAAGTALVNPIHWKSWYERCHLLVQPSYAAGTAIREHGSLDCKFSRSSSL